MQLKFWKKIERRAGKPEVGNVREITEKLQVVRMRLSARLKEMESRYKEMFELVVKAHMEKDESKAAIYAEELAELRKMLRKLTHASLLLEGVTYRLDAVRDLRNASSVMIPLKEILGVASNELSGVAPSASDRLRELIDSIEELSINVGYVSDSGNTAPKLSDEAKKILEEASAIAAQRRRRESE